MTLKAAVIGARMGARHVAAFQAHPDTVVEIVCDIDEDRARRVAAQHGAPRYVTDYRDVIASDVDLVSVATPDQVHREHAVAALDAAGADHARQAAARDGDQEAGSVAHRVSTRRRVGMIP